MKPFITLNGIVAPLDAIHVDTDQIIPKQFLKGVTRTGYGRFLFYDRRYLADGHTPDRAFEMNAPRYKGASILLTKDNFGCGSSREQAPWALADYGFRCIVAPSFADIFYGNCFHNGILPIVLAGDAVEALFGEMRAVDGYRLTVDLNTQTVTTPNGCVFSFDLDPVNKATLSTAPDAIGRTLAYEDAIAAYEHAHAEA